MEHQSTGSDALDPHNGSETTQRRALPQNLSHKPDDKTRATGNAAVDVVETSTQPTDSAQTSVSSPLASKDAEMDAAQQVMLEIAQELGPDDFGVFFFLGLFGITTVSAAAFVFLSWSWVTAIICVFIGFVVWRHITIKHLSPRPQTGRRWITRTTPFVPDTTRLPAVYFLYVLGSGGHTTEMLEIIKRHFKPQANQHRRYLVSLGDTDSLDRVVKLEARIRRAHSKRDAGTLDSFQVPRARRVHQPFWTAPFTCLLTAIWAVNALTREPDARPRTLHGTQFKYPHVVVTNGPATGFIVCAVAHLLKLFYLVPQNRLKMVYVESWARSRTLSLTGRLFLRSGLADVFCVQHETLANRLGQGKVVYVGPLAVPRPPEG